jgi:hypothetical protein
VHLPKILIPTTILLASAGLTPAAANATSTLSTNQSCYLVGQKVLIAGSGFPTSRSYELAVDGVDIVNAMTNSFGGFTASLIPGGLGAGVAQYVHLLTANDGTGLTSASFTVTRTTGARIVASTGAAASLRGPFQLWGFNLVHDKPLPASTPAPSLPVYVHYLSPHHHLRTTVALGHTGGQCGYLKTAKRRVFPFNPSSGLWTLQVDSQHTYSAHPVGPVAKIPVRVS